MSTIATDTAATDIADRADIRQQLSQAIANAPSRASNTPELWHKCVGLLKEKNAVLISHYYVDDQLQQLAEATGGYVGDSLQMAQFGSRCDNPLLIIAGVRFMGETAKILNPDKTVLMLDLKTECSLDLSCPADKFAELCDQYPNHTKVVYANTSAEVKALSDWVVTSSIAVPLIEHLDQVGEQIIWAPDKHLGHYLNTATGANMLLWDGACVVHEEFKSHLLDQMMTVYPQAAVLAHPESPESVLERAHAIGSTSQLIDYARHLDYQQFIVATDRGIFYKMKQIVPDKEFIIAPTAGEGASCRSCAHCPWMALNSLEKLALSLEQHSNAIEIESSVIERALIPLERMLHFGASL